jgi:glutamate synthase (NADPH/NADH) small chain
MSERQDFSKRPVEERVRDYREFLIPLNAAEQSKQAARCMDCGVPFCQTETGCPVENHIPDWNTLVSSGDWESALESLHRTNNFPEFTGKLCPAPCESACVLGINSDPVAIRSIESAIIEKGFAEGWVRAQSVATSSGKKIAVIGSGPAGLAAAQELARAGHEVSVFEKQDRVGGLLRYGIPDFKMEKKILDRRLEQLVQEGVHFVTNIEIGRDMEPEELQEKFDAICLTLGAESPRRLEIPGSNADGIYVAMDFLIAQNRLLAGTSGFRPDLNAKNRHVIILGGGDTGSDCLGTAHRQECASVTQFEILERPPTTRSDGNMWPLWPTKLRTSHAHEEGGNREWSLSTTEFLVENGKVTGLKTLQLKSGIEKVWPADLVLLSLGFSGPSQAPWISRLGIERTSRGNIFAHSNFETSVPGIFSAGDARRGASLIVWAIAEGRKMAASVDRYLRGNQSK